MPSGGNGKVKIENNYAIKTFYKYKFQNEEKVERFRRELEALNFISSKHPDIAVVKIIDGKIGKSSDDSYIKMEAFDGNIENLLYLTKGNPKLVCELLLPVIKALQILSSDEKVKIYHRDLKPANILFKKVSHGYQTKLCDFGVCFISDGRPRVTRTKETVGSKHFIAPEYEMGKVDEVNETCDIYSIGKIIWYLLNGTLYEYLPSNLWFHAQFNIALKYPCVAYINEMNLIINRCVEIEPNKRCSYEFIIKEMESILKREALKDDANESTLRAKLLENQLKKDEEKNKVVVNLNICLSELKIATNLLKQKFPEIRIVNKIYSTISSIRNMNTVATQGPTGSFTTASDSPWLFRANYSDRYFVLQLMKNTAWDNNDLKIDVIYSFPPNNVSYDNPLSKIMYDYLVRKLEIYSN